MEKTQDVQSQNKELKKLMDSHIAVLSHKLGRAPTPEEVMKAMVEEPQEEQAAQELQSSHEEDESPAVLNYRIFFGMKEEEGKDGSKSKKPDPSNILYYHDPRQNRWYDVEARQWSEKQPPMSAHLPDRSLEDDGQGSDIRDAIIHGVMDDSDFQKLCDCPGMVDDRLKKLYGLMGTIKSGTEQLQTMGKSEDLDEAPDFEPESQMEDRTDMPTTDGENVVDAFLDTAGVFNHEVGRDDDEEDVLETEDLTQQISDTAKGSGTEYRVRRWIREEIELMKQDILSEVWAMINSSVDEEIQNTHESMEEPVETEVGEEFGNDLDDDDGGPEELETEVPEVAPPLEKQAPEVKKTRKKKQLIENAE